MIPFAYQPGIQAAGDIVMLKKLALFLSLVFALTYAAPAMTQGLSTVDGLQSAYGRIYMGDTATTLATPDATATPEMGNVPQIARVAVYTFEDSDAASVALEPLADSIADEASEGAGMDKKALDGTGDAAYAYTANVEIDESTTGGIALMVVQDNEHILVTAIVGGEDPDGMALDWAEFMLDAEIGRDEITFADDGTSTGGVFDLMPSSEDEPLLGGLVPIADIDLMEAAEAAG